jgi:hypothetical protein
LVRGREDTSPTSRGLCHGGSSRLAQADAGLREIPG